MGYLDVKKLVRPLVQRGDLEGAIQKLLLHAQANPEAGADALTHAGELALESNVAPQATGPGRGDARVPG